MHPNGSNSPINQPSASDLSLLSLSLSFDVELRQQVHALLNCCDEKQLTQWLCFMLPQLMLDTFAKSAQPCLFVLFVVVVCCLLFVVCCLLFVVCCLLFVVCCTNSNSAFVL